MDLFRQNEPVLTNVDLLTRSPPIPEHRIRDLTPDLSQVSKRDSDSSGQETSGGSDTTPIVIGVVIPVLIIVIILFVIWRRRQKITRQEEANDKYRSLDFGVDEIAVREKRPKRNRPKGPEMSIAEIKGGLRKDRGLSMDLEDTNPYILPPEVHSSRESLHSLSRTLHTDDDKYRATTFIPDDGSIRSPSSMRSHGDGSSVFTASTRHRTGTMDTESKVELIPKVAPKRDVSETPSIRKPMPVVEKPQSGLLVPTAPEPVRGSMVSSSSSNSSGDATRAINQTPAQLPDADQQVEEPKKREEIGLAVPEAYTQTRRSTGEPRQPPVAVVHNESPNPRRQNGPRGSPLSGNGRTESFDRRPPPKSQQQHHPQRPSQHREPIDMRNKSKSRERNVPPQPPPPPPPQAEPPKLRNGHAQHASVPEITIQDQQNDYYDDDDNYDGGLGDYAAYIDYTYRGSVMGVRPLPPDDPTENPEQRANRIRSFYKEYFEDGENHQEGYQDWVYGYYDQNDPQGRQRAYSQGTYGRYSSGTGPRRLPRKKNLPPPKPLKVLPTPHMLKDDDFLPNAIDYAPPQVFKNQRSGTPDSKRGGLRPYSPSVRAHVPLTSSFDDLAVIPSP